MEHYIRGAPFAPIKQKQYSLMKYSDKGNHCLLSRFDCLKRTQLFEFFDENVLKSDRILIYLRVVFIVLLAITEH